VKSKSKSTLPLRVGFITLGCAKNLVDTEKMLGLLVEAGMVLVGSDDPAEAVIINTCGFIAEARQEAKENIEFVLEQKRKGNIGCVIVAGCMAQLQGGKILREFSGVDGVVGLADRDNIAQIVEKMVRQQSAKISTKNASERLVECGDFKKQIFVDQARLRITEPCWAYVRISEGCNQCCSFCTIPSIRGPFRSKPVEAVMAEARELVADGAVELNLIAQETSGYGRDLGYKEGLAGLLRELNEIEGLQWLRVLYVYPTTVTDEIIKTMAVCEKVVPYIDMPLQHINDRILKLMRRGINREKTERLLQKLQKNIDNLAIRTTMLVGFPSETEAEFAELLEFVQEYHFAALGVFVFSAEAGTPAAKMDKQVPEEIKEERLGRLMIAQQEIAFAQVEKQVGSQRECLITRELGSQEIEELDLESGRRWYLGRHSQQAPEIDSECYLAADEPVEPGQIIQVKISARREYDFLGEIEREQIKHK